MHQELVVPLPKNYAALPYPDLLSELQTRNAGLTQAEVLERQKKYGLNTINKSKSNFFTILLRQFTGNPLILILAFSTFISYLLGQQVSSYYIFLMIMVSIALGLWNEYTAGKTIDNLLKKISPTTLVMRNDEKQEIPVSHLTIGDVVLLSQGSIVPADLRLIESKDLEVNESALTGESKTVYKTNLSQTDSSNLAFMGTSVISGSGRGVVINIGRDTQFGKIAKSTTYLHPMTEFQKGLASFGHLIIKVIILLTIVIFLVNTLLGHDFISSALFALAIAVGLTPELLPIIVTVSLAHGAGKLSKKHVVAKRLLSLENLGNMDILCTDKTGTLTEGTIDIVEYIDASGKKDLSVLKLALLCNSAITHHKVLGNAIDVALWEYAHKNNIDIDKSITKIDEEPFDYNRKAMYSVVVNTHTQLIVKGAPESVLEVCSNLKNKKAILEKLKTLRLQGYRVIAIAQKSIVKKQKYEWDDVRDLTLQGFITFLDIPKKSAKEALQRLHSLNVQTKIVTGDNEIITLKICSEVGMDAKKVIIGPDFAKLSEQEIKDIVQTHDIFARVTPEQKLQIIQALQKNGHTVGYLGDGINDIPALHTADAGISVNTAVDVAKDAASIVLLRKNLHVLADGIIEGRKTFNNTIKYILMSTSSNFGNMFSAAGASFFLSFLPMTPVQILLTNGLYDISQLTIPSDNVDPESLIKPRHWNVDFIKNYMIFFGPLSSIYDYLTFFIMIVLFHAKGPLFQTGWFIESIATEILVVFVIRTARSPFFLSNPSKWLLLTCLGIVLIGLLLPFTPLALSLGFIAPPPLYFGILIVLVATYLCFVEIMKSVFLKKYSL